MRIINSNCVILQEPKLKQTLAKFSNMTVEEQNNLKQRIIKNLKVRKVN